MTTTELNPSGWPRPRLPYRKGGSLPAPWIARTFPAGDVDPSSFDCDRIRSIYDDCGSLSPVSGER